MPDTAPEQRGSAIIASVLILLVFLIPFSGLNSAVAPFYLGIYLLVGFVAVISTLVRKFPVSSKYYFNFVFCFLWLSTLSVICNYQKYSYENIKDYVSFVCTFLIPFYFLARIKKHSQLATFHRVLVAFAIILSADVIYQAVFGYDLLGSYPLYAESRATGPIAWQVPVTGTMCLFAVPSVFYLFRDRLYIVLILFLLIGTNIILAGQRIALLIFALMLLQCAVVFLSNRFKSAKFKLFALMIILAVSVAGVVFSGPKNLGRFISRFNFDVRFLLNEQKSKRIEAWITSFHIFHDNMLLGTGPGTFKDAADKYVNKYQETYSMLHPHSLYMDILTGLGLLGLALYCAFIYKLFGKVRNIDYPDSRTTCYLFLNVLFNPLQVCHSFNDVWFSVLYALALSYVIVSVNLNENKLPPGPREAGRRFLNVKAV